LIPDLFLSSGIVGWMRKPKLFSKRKCCSFNLRRSDPGSLVRGFRIPFYFRSVSGERVMLLVRRIVGHGASIGASIKQRTLQFRSQLRIRALRTISRRDIFFNRLSRF
jgi:hypothetical protein